MDIRQPIHSDHARTLDTNGLRRHFLVENMFEADAMTLTYSQIDRIIVGGIMPVGKSVTFGESLAKHTGTSYFLERRELGLINIGGAAKVLVDGTSFDLGPREALYIGSGAKAVEFSIQQFLHYLLYIHRLSPVPYHATADLYKDEMFCLIMERW